MAQPKKQKFRKQFRGKRGGVATANNSVSFGDFGLTAMEAAWIKENNIEAARRAIAGYTKRKGKIWVKIFPDKPYTQKANNSKMIGGKGDVQGYVAVVKPGTVLFEVGGIPEDMAKEALRLASHKLSIKTKMIYKSEI